MLDAGIGDRSHALGGAGILIQELVYSRKIDSLLHVVVLQIVVAFVAQLLVAGVDKVTLGRIFFGERSRPLKKAIVAPGIMIVGGTLVDRLKAVQSIVDHRAHRNRADEWHDKV